METISRWERFSEYSPTLTPTTTQQFPPTQVFFVFYLFFSITIISLWPAEFLAVKGNLTPTI